MAAQKPSMIAATAQRSGQGMALRTDMRGALMVSLRRSNLNRTGGTSHKHKDRPWAALVVNPERD
jgi:hypothetical protein